ncbi:MAG: MetQ/NlpA family ABC transporter substrate-binding protein [Clostridia bacterium]|nr:MetQ/NlpA family ABC transporter substrate-binding protein [Clostridia bacterium]
MKKILSLVLALTLVLGCALSLASCGKKKTVIAVPNDTTNQLRALQLLEVQGLITVKKDATASDTLKQLIVENPYNIEFKEVEAAQLPALLKDVDYAVINSNYAIEAGITPFVTEGTNVSYPNIIAVKAGNENSPKIKALVAAVNSAAVASYIANTYKGAIVCDLVNASENGLDSTVDYAALNGATIKIAASPTPHAEILAKAKEILAGQGITLQIIEYTDYVQPNLVVESGDCDANYFQHVPYLNDFNAENRTSIVSVLEVHHEPMGVYSAKNTSFDAIKNK